MKTKGHFVLFGLSGYWLTSRQFDLWQRTAGLPLGFRSLKRQALLHLWRLHRVASWYAQEHLWGSEYYQKMNARYPP